MGNLRLGRINEEIMRELSGAIRRLKDPRIQGLVSITHVDTTPDMRYAKVYVSSYGDEKQNKSSIKGLNSASGYLRRELGLSLNLRYTPELTFINDDSINKASQIMKLINGIEKPDKEIEDD